MNDTQQFLSDVIVTAVEGGINYWSEIKSYKIRDGVAECQVRIDPRVDNSDNNWHILSPSGIKSGILKINRGNTELCKDYRKQIAGAWATKDAGDIDAPLADVIVQVALYGEIIFG
jgi:hypothetical protein